MSPSADAPAAPDLAAAYAYCDGLIREERRDAWLAALFAPATQRPSLHALQAFFIEIGRIRARVSQPLAGEVRLQWWLDAITDEARGDVAANPIAAALLDTLQRHDISRGILMDALESFRTDLYDEPRDSPSDLEDFFDRTSGGLIRCEVQVLAGAAVAAGAALAAGFGPREAGIATGLAGLLSVLPLDPARAATLIPSSILAAHGLAARDIAAGTASPALDSVLADLRALARTHLAVLRAGRAAIPEVAGPAFLTVNLVEPLLRLSERRPIARPGGLALSPWRQQWILWRAARNGGLL